MKQFFPLILTCLALPFALLADETPPPPPKAAVEAPAADTTPPQTQEEDHPNLKPEASPPQLFDNSYENQFYRTLIIVVVIILLALFVIWIIRRNSPVSTLKKMNHRNNIKILERRAISPQTYVYHIKVGDQQFIISESKVDVRTLATLDWPDSK